LQVDLAALHLR